MILTVMLNLKFNGNLLFCGFLPESKTDYIEIVLEGGKYRLLLFLSDRNKQLSDLDIGNLPTEPEQLKKQMTLHCNSLSLEIQILDIDPEICNALENGKSTEKILALKQEIYNIVLNIHSRITDYFRNIKKQYWLEPLDLDSRNYQSFLDQCDIVWLNSKAEWKSFPRDIKQNVYFNLYMPDEKQGVDEKDWKQLSSFVTQIKPVKMRDVLLANSYKHLAQNNGRLAVVEAVIALESALKQLLPKAIVCIPGAPEITENEIDKVLEKAGLRAITEVVLKIIKVPVGLNNNDIEIVIKAVEARNPIIHNAQRTIEITKARQYVLTIQKTIGIFENLVTQKRHLKNE